MTKTANIHDKQWGLPSPLYGVRHEAIRRANSAQTNKTEEITAVEDCIVAPRAALNAAEQQIAQLEQEIVQLKLDKAAGKAKRTGLRKTANDRSAALKSTQALLATANKRLVENSLETVTAKVAPTANDVAANGGSAETSTPSGGQRHAGGRPLVGGRAGGRAGGSYLKGRVFLFDKPIHVITYLLVPVYKQAFGSYLFTSFVVVRFANLNSSRG
jgi:TolA-binding protein